MNDPISDLRLFTRLVASGSLSAAARALNSSPPVMSRRLAAMEARLGVRLIARTTRTFSLTAEGSVLHERCLKILADIDEAEAEASAAGSSPRGLLRIGAPLEIGRRRIAALIGDFTDLYPGVQATLVLSDVGLDVVDDGLDVLIHYGLPDDESLVATKLASTRRIVCAAPAYIERHGMPRTPKDLAAHNCIRIARGRRVMDSWIFREGGKTTETTVHGTLTTTSAEVMHGWVLAGKGLSRKAQWDVQEDLDSGRLVECLADFWCDEFTLYAAFASRRHIQPKLRFFLDHIKQALR